MGEKKVNGRKRQFWVDTNGFLLRVLVHPADISDTERAIRKPDLWYHDSDHAVLIRSNLVCHDVHFDPIQRIMRPI